MWKFAVLAVLLLLVFFWFVKPGVVTITMTERGYEPNEVTVPIGTTVVFSNADTVGFWPAVDAHPTHTLYDGTTVDEHCNDDAAAGVFDACRSVEPGQTWSFTFNKVGTFPFHDHFWPHLTGTITVVDETGKTEEPVRTLDPYVAKAIAADPSEAIAALEHDAASSSELYARCHEILHDIGKEAFFQYGSFEAASVFQNDFCNSGYIHGVFEAHFSESKDPLIGLKGVCDSFAGPDQRPFDAWQCRHGIGHGFMYFTGGDLPESLQLCTDEFGSKETAEECQNGVYMEIFNQEILAKEAGLVDESDPAAVCAEQELSPADCYTYLPSYLYQTLELDLAEMFAFCSTIPTEFRDSCKLGVGTEFMKRTMASPVTVIERCSEFKNLRDQTICLSGMVNMHINQTGSLKATEALCQEIPDTYQTACQQVVEFRAKDFAPSGS